MEQQSLFREHERIVPSCVAVSCTATSDAPLPTDIDFTLPALSIRQPWAWLILHAGKDIENRNWPTRVRGRVLIHAAKGMTRLEYDNTRDFFYGEIDGPINLTLPKFEVLERGGIIGSVEIVDCVQRSDSPWFFGEFGFVLRGPRPLPFYPCRGQLGFFRVSA